MRNWIAITALLVAACNGDDESDKAGRTEQCERLRDHLIDVRLAGSESLGTIELEKHRAILTTAMGAQFLETCSSTLSDQQIGCLLAAGKSDDLNGCSASSSASTGGAR